MPGYVLNPEIWKALWPLLAFPLASAFAICMIFGSKPHSADLPIVYALSLLGMATGQITGLSRESAVGAVMPAVLTLLGGVMIYLIGLKGERLQTTVVMAVIGLTANLVIGTFWGADLRANPAALAAQAVATEDARFTAAVKKLLNDYEYDSVKTGLERDKPR
jgi:hypothetical protein